MRLVEQCCRVIAGEDRVEFDGTAHETGSSDFGDLTSVMPGVQFYAHGAVGTVHGTDYYIQDPEIACVHSAMAQVLTADALLTDGAAAARKIIDDYQPTFPSIKDYLAFMDAMTADRAAVRYPSDGTVVLEIG